MKAKAGTLAAILVLSLGVWTAFFLMIPESPLTSQETLVVVGACGVAVVSARWILARWRGRRDAADSGSR
ncbi:MAG TPA: hypothetical protein VHO73_01555 [Methylomirabilota bacterium]|jgi:hypothetical protein|nr:hypothetical protein [Methylomirabilota bacterium]